MFLGIMGRQVSMITRLSRDHVKLVFFELALTRHAVSPRSSTISEPSISIARTLGSPQWESERPPVLSGLHVRRDLNLGSHTSGAMKGLFEEAKRVLPGGISRWSRHECAMLNTARKLLYSFTRETFGFVV